MKCSYDISYNISAKQVSADGCYVAIPKLQGIGDRQIWDWLLPHWSWKVNLANDDSKCLFLGLTWVIFEGDCNVLI